MKSHIVKTLNLFKIPFTDKRIIGYRRGMPMDNLQRKIRVINDAIKRFKLEERKEEIVYIGDEEDDLKACQEVGIKFIYINIYNNLINPSEDVEELLISILTQPTL